MTTQDKTHEIARAITTAEHGVVRLIAALAEARRHRQAEPAGNTDGVVDLGRQLPKMLAPLSPEALRLLAGEVGAMLDALAYIHRQFLIDLNEQNAASRSLIARGNAIGHEERVVRFRVHHHPVISRYCPPLTCLLIG